MTAPKKTTIKKTTAQIEVDLQQAERFLTLLAEGEPVTFQTFQDRSGGAHVHILHGDLARHAPFLESLNRQHVGVFVMINAGDLKGRKRENVTGIRALFVDLDSAPLEPVQTCPLTPHMIIESSPGKWHAYWLVTGCELADFEPYQKSIAAKFNGDPKVCDLPRVMRVPGFYHWKGEPFRSRIVELHELQPYPLDEVVRMLELRKKTATGAPEAPQSDDRQRGNREAPKIIEGGRNDFLIKMAGRLRRNGLSEGAIEAALVKVNQERCHPPLDDAEVRRVARSVGRYPAADEVKPDTWPLPRPVAAKLKEVPVLGGDLLPTALRPWLLDISNRMQVRLEMVTMPAIVLAGSLIGAGCGIWPKRRDNWQEVPNLWGCNIAPPASGKTPSRSEVFKPLGILEAEAEAAHQAELREFSVQAETAKARDEAAKDGLRSAAKGKGSLAAAEAALRALREEPVQKPVKRRYRSNDTTVEKLGELLAGNPRGILVERDELVGWLANLDREGRESDRAFYLEAWSGKGSFTTDRIGRGEVYIPRACVAVYGATQPDKILRYLDDAFHSLGNDGLLQRFQLLAYPDPVEEWQYRDQAPDHAARSRAFGVYRHLTSMDFCSVGATVDEHSEIPAFRFSAEAQDVFVDWLTDLENKKLRAADEHPILIEHLGKFRGLMPCLALIFHLVEIAAGAEGGPVTPEAAQLALRWCDYLEQHARRVYGLVIDASGRAAAELADRLRKGQLQDGFSVRDVYRRGWSLLHTPELALAAIDDLVEAGWLREQLQPESEPRPGRPSKPTYTINPRIHEIERESEK